jgi:hypothetical protein
MNLRNKPIAFILLCLTIILVVVLSSQLSTLTFEPGQSYYFQSEGVQLEEGGTTPPQMFDLGGLGRVVGIIILWVILPVSVVYFLISPTARRQVILRVLSISFTTFAMIILVRWLATSGGCSTIQNAGVAATGDGSGEITEVVFTPWDLPSFRYLGSLIMAVIIVAIVYRAWRRIQSRQRPGQLDRIAQEAKSAVADLRDGADLEDTIKRCYFEMSMALQDYHGLERDIGMTPREFEASLHGMGLPLGNVQRLTRLFEEVRYGSKVVGENVEQEAIDLLNAIIQDCKMSQSGGNR